MTRLLLLLFLFLRCMIEINAQCITPINAFPYNEGFESTDGGWVPGGSGNDWAWGTPSKPVISAAGGGTKCWIVGGLTAGGYTNSEASYLQSPCFDFTTLVHPYIECKVFWEMEQQFDGASLQYSIDNGVTWANLGAMGDAKNCLNANWFNYYPITYLGPLSMIKEGWSGNIQSTAGSCRGGNGSNGWVVAKHTMPSLAGQTSVIFRFIFGAGTICNNYDGFAIDDILISEAAPNSAAFTYACGNTNTVNFTNTSALCPSGFAWDFGDPASGTNNTATAANPSHVFSAAGNYTVTFTVTGPGNAPSTITQTITVINVVVTMLSPADCLNNTGGSLQAAITGSSGPFNYSWNTSPIQTTPVASNLGAGNYTITVTGTGICMATATGRVETDFSCIGVYFPTAFTPNNSGKNDRFGPLGSLSSLSDYKLSIYNRWGQRVFYSINPFEKWDGNIGGSKTDANIFVWFAEFSLPGKQRELRKGTIILIR